jgi:predicted amidohydrolase
MRSVNDVAINAATCASLVKKAASLGCKIIFFPEAFSFVGSKPGEVQKVAEPLDGPAMERYRKMARESKCWLSLGGFQVVPTFTSTAKKNINRRINYKNDINCPGTLSRRTQACIQYTCGLGFGGCYNCVLSQDPSV